MIGSKAETLNKLQNKLSKSKIADMVFFNHEQWIKEPSNCLEQITSKMIGEQVIVRSSALGEDSLSDSMAGKFISIPNVRKDKLDLLESAINNVFNSYDKYNGNNQILIQTMINNVEISGVVFTKDIRTGAPYYIISYDDESGRTDTITSGGKVAKSLIVWRGAQNEWLESSRMRKVISAVKEIEDVCSSSSLDIEFAIDRNGTLWTFQVRRITTQSFWNKQIAASVKTSLENAAHELEVYKNAHRAVCGKEPVFGNMSDWNPAEMIGTSPSPLAFSLYRNLITASTWSQSRKALGYKDITSEELMIKIAGHPFIDVRNSFNSFLPEGLNENICHRIVDAWLDRVNTHPDLHDKIEFEVATTCFAPDHNQVMRERYEGVLSQEDSSSYSSLLLDLTNNIISNKNAHSLHWCEQQAKTLEYAQLDFKNHLLNHTTDSIPDLIQNLLDQCRTFGTYPFAIAARHAFIGEYIFRCLIDMDIISPGSAAEFRQNIHTITDDILLQIGNVKEGIISAEDFFLQFGHIRPNTYDISSPRYDHMPHFFDTIPNNIMKKVKHVDLPIILAKYERAANKVFSACGYTFNFRHFLDYFVKGVQMREQIKFIFTRHLSHLLEVLANFGEAYGLSREDLSFIDIHDICNLRNCDTHHIASSLHTLTLQGQETTNSFLGVQMGYLLRKNEDLFVIPVQRNKPNFVTHSRVSGHIKILHSSDGIAPNISGKIVCIEHADPGFDWIFACNILGLVTKYGGANSHMSIRCAEFGIPAAIGCGEAIYTRLINSTKIEIDCKSEQITPIF